MFILMRCFLKRNQANWDEHLQQLPGAIRSKYWFYTQHDDARKGGGYTKDLPEDIPADYVSRLRRSLIQTQL